LFFERVHSPLFPFILDALPLHLLSFSLFLAFSLALSLAFSISRSVYVFPSGQAVEAGLSLERIRSYLLSPEVRPLPPLPAADAKPATPPVHVSPLRIGDGSSEGSTSLGAAALGDRSGGSGGGGGATGALPRLELRHASFEWDGGAALLSNVSLSVKAGELCCVVGATGSGKSGLLSAILGELDPTGGSVTSRGRIAYVSQVAWIQNASLKDNVLFGRPLDGDR
jgi:ABC-type multidrug transport system fused ATPase/permease subunit